LHKALKKVGHHAGGLMHHYVVLFQKLWAGAEDEDEGVRKKIEDILAQLEEVFVALTFALQS
jgi:hypothetical protein